MGKSKRKGGSSNGGGGGGGGGGAIQRRNIIGYASTTTNAASNASSGGSDAGAGRSRQPYVSPRAKRESDLGSTLIHLGIIWLVVGVLIQVGRGYIEGRAGGMPGTDSAAAAAAARSNATSATSSVGVANAIADFVAKQTLWKGYAIPREQLQSMDAYPNPLQITAEIRNDFHPVVVFDDKKKRGGGLFGGQRKIEQDAENNAGAADELPYKVMDFTNRMPNDDQDASFSSSSPSPGSLIPPDQWNDLMKQRKRSGIKIPYTVGRYDEDRRNMYSSDLFSKGGGEEALDKRTVHIGIDIGGPVGTKVYAFADGVIYSAGYNDAWGDYGHVIVVEHDLGNNPRESCPGDDASAESTPSTCSNKIWALYGHLDAGSIRFKKPGKRVKKGQVLGRMGDLNHNGGWYDPHVHFQLSIEPPETHDMPGVVTTADRPRALVEYPDPRLVLGPLY